MPTYTVLRQHLGERMYLEGEIREAAEVEVAHLIAAGVLGAPEPPPAPKPHRARKAGDA
ncbi:hypothetical protein [Rhodovulum viride]|uniref:hypothetical protein n=1 Tax=Rhodovulum viride TaxID=1231134 RepID=UPI0015EC87D7|nr:hypothetical protein [Rhodovulum viride]